MAKQKKVKRAYKPIRATVNITVKTYNNKSRQGKYYYVKAKGVREQVLKYEPNKNRTHRDITNTYKKNFVLPAIQQRNIKEARRQAERIIGKTTPIRKLIRPITYTKTLMHGNNMTIAKTNSIMKEIAEAKLPENPDRAKVWIRRNRHRFKYTVSTYNSQGELLSSFIDTTGKLPREFLHTYFVKSNELKKGNMVSYTWRHQISKIGGVRTEMIGTERQGIIARVQVSIQYR